MLEAANSVAPCTACAQPANEGKLLIAATPKRQEFSFAATKTSDRSRCCGPRLKNISVSRSSLLQRSWLVPAELVGQAEADEIRAGIDIAVSEHGCSLCASPEPGRALVRCIEFKVLILEADDYVVVPGMLNAAADIPPIMMASSLSGVGRNVLPLLVLRFLLVAFLGSAEGRFFVPA